MPIVEIHPINKRDQRITLDNGIVLNISVEQIFRVNFYLNDAEVGHLKFESLSSLNNLEMRPIYKINGESFKHPALSADTEQLREAAIALYQSYTNGKILLSKEKAA